MPQIFRISDREYVPKEKKECYACKNQLVGQIKDKVNNIYWECLCDDTPDDIIPENVVYEDVYCPLCNKYFFESKFLKTEIKNKKTLWIANMITHYRHNHISSWDKMWDRNTGVYYRNASYFGDYETVKQKVNERAKRQILRKCKDFIKANDIKKEDFLLLEENEQKTLDLIEKILTV